MRKFKLLLALLMATTMAIAQNVPDNLRTLPTPATGANRNNKAQVDANLKASLSLSIPRGSAFTLNGAKDSIGYVMFNTTSQRFGVYAGNGVWQTYLISSDLPPIVTSFNTRTGAVTLNSSDVTTALGFTPVPNSRTIAGFPLTSNVTLAAHTTGFGLSGSSYTGATTVPWAVDSTVVGSKAWALAAFYTKATADNKFIQSILYPATAQTGNINLTGMGTFNASFGGNTYRTDNTGAGFNIFLNGTQVYTHTIGTSGQVQSYAASYDFMPRTGTYYMSVNNSAVNINRTLVVTTATAISNFGTGGTEYDVAMRRNSDGAISHMPKSFFDGAYAQLAAVNNYSGGFQQNFYLTNVSGGVAWSQISNYGFTTYKGDGTASLTMDGGGNTIAWGNGTGQQMALRAPALAANRNLYLPYSTQTVDTLASQAYNRLNYYTKTSADAKFIKNVFSSGGVQASAEVAVDGPISTTGGYMLVKKVDNSTSVTSSINIQAGAAGPNPGGNFAQLGLQILTGGGGLFNQSLVRQGEVSGTAVLQLVAGDGIPTSNVNYTVGLYGGNPFINDPTYWIYHRGNIQTLRSDFGGVVGTDGNNLQYSTATVYSGDINSLGGTQVRYSTNTATNSLTNGVGQFTFAMRADANNDILAQFAINLNNEIGFHIKSTGTLGAWLKLAKIGDNLSSFVNDPGYITSASLAGYELLSNKSTNTSLGSSNTAYPSQLAVKTYVDNQIAAVPVNYLTTNTNQTSPINTGDKITSGTWTFRQSALSTTTTDAVNITNGSAAALNAQQVSPSLHFASNGWGTTLGTSQSTDWRIYNIPTQGAGASGTLTFESSNNGGAYATRLTLSGSNMVMQDGNIVAQKNGITTTSTDGFRVLNSTAATSGVPVQYSPRIRFTGAAWNTTATAASNTIDFIQELRPSTGATTGGTFVIAYSNNNGTYTDLLNLTQGGSLRTLSGYANIGGGNNAILDLQTTGALISRNIADANAALIINQANASSTGNIVTFQANGATMGFVSNGGSMAIASRLGIGTTGTPGAIFAMENLTFSTGQTYSTNGLGMRQVAATYTSTATAGSPSIMGVNTFGVATLAATNVQAISKAATWYIQGAPTTGTNVSIANSYALYINAGDEYLGGNLTLPTTSTITDGNTTINNNGFYTNNGSTRFIQMTTSGIAYTESSNQTLVNFATPVSGSNIYTIPSYTGGGTFTMNQQPVDIEVSNSAKGLILKSPDGTRWRLTVSNAGAAVFTSI